MGHQMSTFPSKADSGCSVRSRLTPGIASFSTFMPSMTLGYVAVVGSSYQ